MVNITTRMSKLMLKISKNSKIWCGRIWGYDMRSAPLADFVKSWNIKQIFDKTVSGIYIFNM